MFHQKAIQNSWRQSVHRHANVVYLGASVGVQKIAGSIFSKLNVTSSPELLSALAEYKLGFSLEVLTASHAVHAVDEPMDPGMNLRNEPESGPHAYEVTDSLFVSLDNEAVSFAVGQLDCSSRITASSRLQPGIVVQGFTEFGVQASYCRKYRALVVIDLPDDPYRVSRDREMKQVH
jgi:hypothetical protein